MKLLELQESDIKSICQMQKDDFADGWNENLFLSGFKTGNILGFVAKQAEKLAGYITYTLSVDSADVLEIYVDKVCRNKKIGTMLLEECLNRICAKKVKKVFLEVRESNKPALNLYAKNGFKTISLRKKYYPDGENACVMLKEI